MLWFVRFFHDGELMYTLTMQTQIQPPTLPVVDGAMKVGLVGSVGLARFIKSIEA
jgi:hypothetical protein